MLSDHKFTDKERDREKQLKRRCDVRIALIESHNLRRADLAEKWRSEMLFAGRRSGTTRKSTTHISPAALKLLPQLTHLILGAYHSGLTLRPPHRSRRLQFGTNQWKKRS